jgi:hypothetical protein
MKLTYEEEEIICDRNRLTNDQWDEGGGYCQEDVALALARLERRIIVLKGTLQLIKDGSGPIDELIDQTLRYDGRIK